MGTILPEIFYVELDKVPTIEGKDCPFLGSSKSQLFSIRNTGLACFICSQHINLSGAESMHKRGPLSIFIHIQADCISH